MHWLGVPRMQGQLHMELSAIQPYVLARPWPCPCPSFPCAAGLLLLLCLHC